MNNIDLTAKNLREQELNSEPKENTDINIRTLLDKVEMSSYIQGYEFWVIAIKLYKENPNISLTKQIYPQIAKKFGMIPSRVEGVMRLAIGHTFNRCPDDIFDSIFGDIIYHRNSKPTNWEFLTALAKQI